MEDTEILFRRSTDSSNPGDQPARSFVREGGREGGRIQPTTGLASAEDGDLLALVGQGDEAAMAAIFDRYSRVVYSVSLRVLRDSAAAEDVLQEVFLQVWRKPDRVAAGRGTFGAWLAVVSRNRSIDIIRRRKPSETVEDVVLVASGDLAKDAERNILLDKARAVIGRLPVDQRKTLEMAFFDGLTHSEIAETTGDPLGTVKTRIRSALLVLRKAMQS